VGGVLVCLRHITFDFQGEGCNFVGEKLHVSPDQRRRTVSNILQCIETIDALKTPAGGTMAQKTVVKSLLELLQNVLVFLTYHLSLSGASCVDARVDSRILNVLVNNQPSVRGDRPNRSGFIQQKLTTLLRSIRESSTHIIRALVTANAIDPDSDIVGVLGKILPTNGDMVVPLLIAYCSSVERKTELGNSPCIMKFVCDMFQYRIPQMAMLPWLQLLHLMCEDHPHN